MMNDQIPSFTSSEEVRDETRHKKEEEIRKCLIIINEIENRLKELYVVLKCINKNECIILIYLLLVHHELYVKSRISEGDMFELMQQRKYNHDILYLIEVADIKNKKQEVTIKKHCNIIKTKTKIDSIKNYPNFRYNTAVKNFDKIRAEDIVLYDINFNEVPIVFMVNETLKGFSGDR